jgi:DnaJ-related protein SCJ1
MHGSQFMFKKRILCDRCRGSGAASDGDIHTCGGCGGTGVKVRQQQIFPGMFAQSQMTCNECGGAGRIIKRKCPHCQGAKVTDHTATYTLDVPTGMPEGYDVTFESEGDESPDWEPGDLILRVRSRKEKGGWRRKESSLYWKETIGIDEVRGWVEKIPCIINGLQALLGFEHNITHLDGRAIKLSRNGVTQPGASSLWASRLFACTFISAIRICAGRPWTGHAEIRVVFSRGSLR